MMHALATLSTLSTCSLNISFFIHRIQERKGFVITQAAAKSSRRLCSTAENHVDGGKRARVVRAVVWHMITVVHDET